MRCLEACLWANASKFRLLDHGDGMGMVRYGAALLAHFMTHYRISSTTIMTSTLSSGISAYRLFVYLHIHIHI